MIDRSIFAEGKRKWIRSGMSFYRADFTYNFPSEPLLFTCVSLLTLTCPCLMFEIGGSWRPNVFGSHLSLPTFLRRSPIELPYTFSIQTDGVGVGVESSALFSAPVKIHGKKGRRWKRNIITHQRGR